MFYDSFLFNEGSEEAESWVRVPLNAVVSVRVGEAGDLDVGDESARVLELFQDARGEWAGDKAFRGRWLFHPHHLEPAGHPERTRVRRGLDAKQVFEHCDATADGEVNPLGSVRGVQRVLCVWDSPLNRQPTPEQLRQAHFWLSSGWNNLLKKVVPLNKYVDQHPINSACAQPPCRARAGVTPL